MIHSIHSIHMNTYSLNGQEGPRRSLAASHHIPLNNNSCFLFSSKRMGIEAILNTVRTTSQTCRVIANVLLRCPPENQGNTSRIGLFIFIKTNRSNTGTTSNLPLLPNVFIRCHPNSVFSPWIATGTITRYAEP